MKKIFKPVNLVLIILSVFWLLPFGYILINAGKSVIEYNNSYFWELPTKLAISENIQFLTGKIKVGEVFSNSLIYGIIASTLGIYLSALAAYGLSTLKLKHSNRWFLLIYMGTIFPFQMYLIPNFKLFQVTGLYDTKLGMILIYTAMIIPFSVFVFRNFFWGISSELKESADIDGATNWQTFHRIYLPLAKPSLFAVLLFQFSWIWGDLLFGMTLTKSDSARSIMSAVSMISGASKSSVPPILLIALIISIPTLLVFVISNKYLENGVAFTSK